MEKSVLKNRNTKQTEENYLEGIGKEIPTTLKNNVLNSEM